MSLKTEMLTEKESHLMEKLPSSLVIRDCTRRSEEDILTNGRCKQNTCVSKLNAFLCLIYLIFRSIFTQSIALIVKKLSYMSTCQLSLIRYAGIFAAILPLSIYWNKQILGEKKDRFLLAVRGLLSANGLFFQLVAYRYLQLVEASIVMSISPFVTAIIARILLKESLGLSQTIALFTTICGVCLSLKLPETLNNKTYTHFDIFYAIGLLSSVLSVLCHAVSTVAIRKLKKVHFSIIILYTSFIGMFENAVLNGTVFPLVTVECGWDQILCLLLGVFGTFGNCFLTLANQLEPAAIVAVQISSLDILVTIVFQILFFFIYPDEYVISGACLVIASLIIIGLKKWALTMPETSSKRQKLKWILL